MKKRFLMAGAITLLCAAMLTACAGNGTNRDRTGKVQIVCSNFAAYDWAREVVGERADDCDIRYLMANGVDLHSYQPTVEDIASIADANLFVFVGGESDEWARDALRTAGNDNTHVVSMMEAIGTSAVEEEVVEGMEAEGEHEGDANAATPATGDPLDDDQDMEYDEHVWLSLRNAEKVIDAIADELSVLDPQGASTYKANADAYAKKLAELDKRYTETVAGASKDTLVFADRFPFRYLTDDYGLSYFAAFSGCSAETEASFETVTFLANKLDELGLSKVLVIDGSDQRIAKTVIENTKNKDQEILSMDSLQSTSMSEAEAGKTYLSAMEGNLDVLGQVLA